MEDFPIIYFGYFLIYYYWLEDLALYTIISVLVSLLTALGEEIGCAKIVLSNIKNVRFLAENI